MKLVDRQGKLSCYDRSCLVTNSVSDSQVNVSRMLTLFESCQPSMS